MHTKAQDTTLLCGRISLRVVEHEMDHVWPVGSFVIRSDSILHGTKGCKYSVSILKAKFGVVCCECVHTGGDQLTRIT